MLQNRASRLVVVETSEDHQPTYTIVEGGSSRGNDILVDPLGYRYVLKIDKRRTNIVWRCHVQNKTLRCHATVAETGGKFRPGPRDHICGTAVPGMAEVAEFRRDMRRELARRVFNANAEVMKEINDMAAETDWRRSWQPDLRASPWKPIEIDEKMYLIKTRFYTDSYELMITDLTLTWYENLSTTALQKRIQILNPSFEAPVSKIVSHIQTNLDDRSKDTSITAFFKDAEVLEGQENMPIKMESKLAGMPFVWHFIGKPAEKDMFPEHLTIPLLTMIGELTRRQQELVRIISSKDREIEDYRSQGVRTSRKHLETGKFDQTAFDAEMTTSKGFDEQVKGLGLLSMNTQGQDLYRQLMTKYAWLTRAPNTGMELDDSLSLSASLSHHTASSVSGPSWANRLPPSFTSLNKSPSPKKSPTKSPASVEPIVSKSPRGAKRSTPDTSPIKESELIRREALEKKLADEDVKKELKAKKKKKIGF